MSDAAEPAIEVTHHPERRRYEITVDGRLAGHSRYADRGRVRTFVHTEIDDAFEGMGLGSRLVRDALADVRASGMTVVPRCPFVRDYMERHPEVADLLAPEGDAR